MPKRVLVQLLACFAIGVVAAALVVGTAALISSDMRWMFGLGAAVLFVAAAWIGQRRLLGPIGPIVSSAPLVVFFSLVVLPQVPELWTGFLLLWGAAIAIGWTTFTYAKARVIGAVVLAATSIWYATEIVPGAVARSLDDEKSHAAPDFMIERLEGAPLTLVGSKGRVLVLDFFATWCAPCREELPELELLRTELADRHDIDIIVVSDGSESIDKIRTFVTERRSILPFAYDHDGEAHDAFGMSGLPALIVIDRDGTVRLVRQGFNRADVDFRARLKQRLLAL